MKLVSADLNTEDVATINSLVKRMGGITTKHYVRMSIILTTEALLAVMKLEQEGKLIRDEKGQIKTELVRETLVQLLTPKQGESNAGTNTNTTDAAI